MGKKQASVEHDDDTKYEHGRGEFVLNLERHMENMSFLALVPKIRIQQEQRQFACKRMRHA